MALTWLHLTDLHLGLSGQEYLFPNVKAQFQRDLELLTSKHCGPIDLILFTGDLVQRGDSAEFEQFEELMVNLRALFAEDAVFLAIPGNHDLNRPRKPADSAVAGLLKLWDVATPNETSVQDLFWSDKSSSQRKVVETAFENYVAWWNRSALNPTNGRIDTRDARVLVTEYKQGLLPGDFRCTVSKDGLSLGVMGLNSTFLQLLGGDFEGKLSIGPEQVAELCPQGLPDWVNAHHLAFLLTHQPPSWFTKKAQQAYEEEINELGRFALHMFGHMHTGQVTYTASGNSEERRWLQGKSLFGMEFIGESQRVERLHGYSVGCVELDEGRWRTKIWPRRAERAGGKRLVFGSDREAGELLSDLYIECAPRHASTSLRVRRLLPTDANYFRDSVYPLLDRIPPNERKPAENMVGWLREPDPDDPDSFIVAEVNNNPVGFLYCGPCSKDYLFISYLVTQGADQGQKLGSTSKLLMTELKRLLVAGRRAAFLMEMAHPGTAATNSERIERLGRIRLFSSNARNFGFDLRIVDTEYLQPALLSGTQDVPQLLILARPSKKDNPDSLSREQAERLLRMIYQLYPLGFSMEPEETKRFEQHCATICEALVGKLPEQTLLLTDRQLEQRYPRAANRY